MMSYLRCERCGHAWQASRLAPGRHGTAVKSDVAAAAQSDAGITTDWLPLRDVAHVKVKSDWDGKALAEMIGGDRNATWTASVPGEQAMEMTFHQPRHLNRIRLVFEETGRPRTHEITLSASILRGEAHREILRRRFTFNPPATTQCIVDECLSVKDVSSLVLRIVPDVSGRHAVASVRECRIA